MARTRSSKGNDKAASKDTTTGTTSTGKYTLSPPSNNPPKIFILPTKATKEARIVSLLHPRYEKPTRYLVCPETGFYEFTRIAAPKATPRSWLVQTRDGDEDDNAAPKAADGDASFGAYVTNGAELFVATPLDPLFLILPALIDAPNKSENSRYISSDDHFDRIQEQSPHLWEILRWGEGRVRNLLEARLGAVCDTVEAGDERMYRFSDDKLAAEIVGKAKRMSSRPLPLSMEEKFVTKPLEAPLLGVKREPITTTTPPVNTTSDSQDDNQSMSGTSTPKVDTSESQSSISTIESSTSTVSDASTAATSVAPGTPEVAMVTDEEEEEKTKTQSTGEAQLLPAIIASDDVIALQRMRTAFEFLCSAYMPRSLAIMLRAHLTTQPGLDFAPLDTYLSELNRLKQEAAASRSAGDYGRKRVLDEEEIAERAEKKRKKDEEDKRKKAGESRGVKNLKKVNTAGMKKMSDFFKKKG
ncbi:ribonuclease H2, subunit B [Poronia punctata]|nr:ribonuclease H2, subunit B [Poronia punctata]